MNEHRAEPIRPQHLISSKGLRADEAKGEVEGEAMMCGKCQPGEEDENLEARAPRIANRPYVPTKAEIAAHFPLHAEYRPWCKCCVHGKGISRQHAAGDNTEEVLGVTISIDYCFMVPEESEEEMDAILIAYDSHKMRLWAMTADAKGPTPQAVGWLSGKIEESENYHEIRSRQLDKGIEKGSEHQETFRNGYD